MTRSYMGYVSSQTTSTVAAGVASSIPTVYTFTTTGSNSWTVPTGVTYVIANIQAGGGGTSNGATAGGTGGSSSVAFAAGTQTATGGGSNGSTSTFGVNTNLTDVTPEEYGAGGKRVWSDISNPTSGGSRPVVTQGAKGGFLRVGGEVTPGATLTITVGAGGTAGTNGTAGRQGIVTLEAYSENKRRCELFKSSGTFTPPAGVTKVLATIVGGAGGMTLIDGAGTAGGSSSVAFAAGTQTASGGSNTTIYRVGYDSISYKLFGVANTGDPTLYYYAGTGGGVYGAWANCLTGTAGRRILVSGDVTPSTGISVTVGAGGNVEGVSNASASGFVNIEYEVP